MILNRKKCYLQIALNSTLAEAHSIISNLPASDRILIEAGTPLIKAYGSRVIEQLRSWYQQRIFLSSLKENKAAPIYFLSKMFENGLSENRRNVFQEISAKQSIVPYVVADLKTMDRGDREAEIAAKSGASAAICLGEAPIETIDLFIASCKKYGIDSMVDMMNAEYPLSILRKLKQPPDVVIVHRGVDEERFNKEKQIPYHEIHRIKGAYDIMISIAGGDTIREVQRAIFNDADIVVVWREFYQSTTDTAKLAEEFLKNIK